MEGAPITKAIKNDSINKPKKGVAVMTARKIELKNEKTIRARNKFFTEFPLSK